MSYSSQLNQGVFNVNTGLGLQSNIDELETRIESLETDEPKNFHRDGSRLGTGTWDLDDNSINNINNCDVTTLSIGDTAVSATATEINILSGVTVSTSEINYNDLTSIGYGEASKTMTLDSSRNIQNINTLTASSLVSTYLQVNSSINTNLITPISPATEIGIQLGNLNMTENDIINIGLCDVTTLSIGDVSVTATATELNYNDISTLGTVEASKTVTADASRDIQNINTLTSSIVTTPSITSTGNLIHDIISSYFWRIGVGLTEVMTLSTAELNLKSNNINAVNLLTATTLLSANHQANSANMNFSINSGYEFVFKVNGSEEYSFSNSTLDMNSNSITNAGLIYSTLLVCPGITTNASNFTHSLSTGYSYLFKINGVTEYEFTKTKIDLNNNGLDNIGYISATQLTGTLNLNSQNLTGDNATITTLAGGLTLGSNYAVSMPCGITVTSTTNSNTVLSFSHGYNASNSTGAFEIKPQGQTNTALFNKDGVYFYLPLDNGNQNISNVNTLFSTNVDTGSCSCTYLTSGNASVVLLKPLDCGALAISNASSISATTGTFSTVVSTIGNFTNLGATTMTGNLNMNSQAISNVTTLTATTINAFTVGGTIDIDDNHLDNVARFNISDSQGYLSIYDGSSGVVSEVIRITSSGFDMKGNSFTNLGTLASDLNFAGSYRITNCPSVLDVVTLEAKSASDLSIKTQSSTDDLLFKLATVTKLQIADGTTTSSNNLAMGSNDITGCDDVGCVSVSATGDINCDNIIGDNNQSGTDDVNKCTIRGASTGSGHLVSVTLTTDQPVITINYTSNQTVTYLYHSSTYAYHGATLQFGMINYICNNSQYSKTITITETGNIDNRGGGSIVLNPGECRGYLYNTTQAQWMLI